MRGSEPRLVFKVKYMLFVSDLFVLSFLTSLLIKFCSSRFLLLYPFFSKIGRVFLRIFADLLSHTNLNLAFDTTVILAYDNNQIAHVSLRNVGNLNLVRTSCMYFS